MTDTGETSDLIVVVADNDAKNAVQGLLERRESLAIRKVSVTIDRYVGRDSGCYGKAHEYLRPFVRMFDYALVVFDRHGSGREQETRETIEADVERRLARNGWADRAAAIVLDPELEIWIWSDSPEVPLTLGWGQREPNLQTWLTDNGFLTEGDTKPQDPKEAMEKVLRIVRKRRSSAIYRELADKVSLRRCADPAFEKLTTTLRKWFPK